jgi:hypothetical protein
MASGSPGNMPFVSPLTPTPIPQPPPPPPPPPRPAITSTYIASGTEGCIVNPALPNLSVNGSSWEEYPDYVTKLYKIKDDFNKALTNSQKITGLLHNNSHAVYPYRYKSYKGFNIPTTVKEKQKNGSILNIPTISKCDMKKKDTLLPLRMKNLGVSIDHLSKNKAGSLDKAKTIPFTTILDNINRIYRQIRTLFTSGYIHGDVRQTNIMLDPNTGKITLIDFGWLYPVDVFFNTYKESLGYYSNPPESLFYCSINNKDKDASHTYLSWILGSKVNEGLIRITIPDHFIVDKNLPVRRLIKTYLYNSNGAKNIINIADLQAALINAALYFKSKIAVVNPRNYGDEFNQYYNLMAPSFDLYGLSFTIHMLIQSVYASLDTITKGGTLYSGEELTLIQTTIEGLVRDVIKPGMDLDITKRIDILQACERLDLILNTYHDAKNSMAGGRRRRKTQKRRRGGRKTLRRK